MAKSPKPTASAPPSRWSQPVTQNSNALDLEPGVFTWDDPRAIAESLRSSAERSARRKAGPFRSAMAAPVSLLVPAALPSMLAPTGDIDESHRR